jgi:hypothetical protein
MKRSVQSTNIFIWCPIGLLVWPSESHKYPKRCLQIYVFNFDATPRKQFADPLTAFNSLFSDATGTKLPYLHSCLFTYDTYC